MTFSKPKQTTILALLALTVLHGCSNHSPEIGIPQFWNWFGKEYATPPELSRAENANVDAKKITKKLQIINKGLSAEIQATETKKQILIVSADGNKKIFPLVKEVVRQAPDLPAWTVVAFKPRVDKLRPVESDGVIVSPEDIFFTAQPHDGIVDVCVLLDHTIPPVTAEKIAILMLDQALGEYEAGEKIGKITFAPITELNEDNSNFRELKKAVDDYCK